MQNNVGGSLGGSSLLVTPSQSTFDVRKESDVISLLKIAHQNPLDPELKNFLRDLIFTYRQDVTVENLTKLSTAFAPLGITIENPNEQKAAVVVESKKSSPKKFGIGGARPQPAFVPVTSVPQRVPVAPVKERVKPSEWPKEVSTPKTEVAPEAVATVDIPAPASVPQDEPAVAVKEPVAEVVAPLASQVNANDRIKEIKKLVNQKVGNPVNLIDAHNDIGREYMNALLDAMKKTNGGQVSEVVTAMERLEKAFGEVQRVLESGSTAETIAPIAVEPEVVVTEEQPQPQAQAPEPVVVQEVIAPEPLVAEVVAPTVEAPVNTPVEEVPKMPSVMERLQMNKEATSAVVDTTQVEAEGVHSVAKEKQLQDLMRATREKEAQTFKQQEDAKIASMDPLQTPEVSSGLAQLLSEWTLFKSSGIFGTGPSGKDHVLYQKLAPLMMAAVIAGRFEGATPKIKQSITDYMNGWRYEEGIVHEHGETFEHYLRRVIHHILQKKKKQ